MGTIFDSYLNSRQASDQQFSNQLGALSGIMGLQSQLEMKPLQIEQMRIALQQAKQNAHLREMLQGQLSGAGGAPSAPGGAGAPPMAFGEGGISTPGGGQANMMTGQSVPPGMPPPLPQQGKGAFAGVNPMAAALMLSGDAGMGKIGTAIQEANKPLAAREGAPVINPQTGEILFYAPKLETGMMPSFSGGKVTGVSNIPGFVPSMAERTASTEGIKAGMDPFLGELDAQGRPIAQTRAEFAQGRQGAQPPPLPPNLPTLRTDAPTDQDALRIAQQADARGQQVSVTGPAPGQPPPLPGAPTLPGQPPALPGQARRGMGQSPAEAAADKETQAGRAKAGVEFENTILEGGRKARDSMTTLQMIAPNLEKMPTGPLYPTLVNAKAYLQQLGLAVDPNLGPAQATKAILNGLALKARDPSGGAGMPGAMSDPDRKFLVEMIPGLDKLPDGNKILLDSMMRLEQRKMDEAAIVQKMQADRKSSADIREALSQYGIARPMFEDYSKRFASK